MPDFVFIIAYIALTALVVWLSVLLGNYVDLMDKKSNISGAFIGGVLLAAVTSLPELFTSISAIWIVKDNNLVVGDILGSNLINLTFLGLILLMFTNKFRKSKIGENHKTTLLVAIVIYALVLIAMCFSKQLQFGWFNLLSPIIFAIYVLFIYKTPRTEEGEAEVCDSKLTLKQVVARFAICAAVLIVASIGITYTADKVAGIIGLNSTVAGALFLGIATSIPELISSITLCYRGNFNASAGNIFGSNMFNFFIITFADFISFGSAGGVMYPLDINSLLLAAFGIIASLTMLLMLLIKERYKKNGLTTPALVGVQSLNAIPIILYALFLIIPSVTNIVL